MGVVKYVALFLLCGWMFFLGLLVGRGTAPIAFDTEAFQKRLGLMAREQEENRDTLATLDLDFYEVLKKPVQTRQPNPDQTSLDQSGFDPAGEIFPEKVEPSDGDDLSPEGVPIIKSRKAMTFNSKAVARQEKKQKGIPGRKKKGRVGTGSGGKTDHAEKRAPDNGSTVADLPPGRYTIQIAAYKSLADAVQQMKALKSKGFTTYRTMGKTGNTIWHRVRAGSFESRKAAEKALQKLNNARVKGMIIKKE